MKLFSVNLEDLRALYRNTLQKALSMEQQITKALPTMIEKATDPQLKRAFEMHLRQTEGHVTKVQSILNEELGEANPVKCKVLASLVGEAEEAIKDAASSGVRDASLIASAQQVEHHEMAIYGTLRTWAELLGSNAQAIKLEEILGEEKNADMKLTEIAGRLNQEAEVPVREAA